MAHTPLFQVMFTWQNAERGSVELSGLELGAAGAGRSGDTTAKFDLFLTLQEVDGRIGGGLEYATALFEAETVERYAGYLRAVLQAMVAREEEAVSRLPLLSPAERHQVVEGWNATEAAFPSESCVHELVERQVERTPDAVAVAFEDDSLTYAQLNARANQLAHHLRGLGVGPDARVGICAERSLEMVVGMLGILKSGGAYVPLDPQLPRRPPGVHAPGQRPRGRAGAGPPGRAAAGCAGAPGAALGPGGAVAELPRDEPRPRGGRARAGSPGLRALHLRLHGAAQGRDVRAPRAGQPPGVDAGRPRDAARRGAAAEDAVRLRRLLLEFFWPLMVGARLVMARPEGHMEPRYLAAVIERERITTVHFVPSMLQLWLEEEAVGRCTSLSRVVCSGEALPAHLARRVRARLPGAAVLNQYGPTETGEVTEWSWAPGEPESGVNIGRPHLQHADLPAGRGRGAGAGGRGR
jgi:non-ribosomal peptide synthetase component F